MRGIRDIKVYWGIWSHYQIYLELCIILSYTNVPHSEPWLIQNPRHLQKPVKHVMIRHIQSPGLVRTVFQAFSRIFRYIQRCWCIFSYTHTYITKGEKLGIPCPFWKSKKLSWFWKERPWLCLLWVTFSIQNIVLTISRRKTLIFPCAARCYCFLVKCLSKCYSSISPCCKKALVVHLHLFIMFDSVLIVAA